MEKKERQTSKFTVSKSTISDEREINGMWPRGSHNHGRSKSKSKKNIKCYNCSKKGNVKKDCWNNQNRREGKEPKSLND